MRVRLTTTEIFGDLSGYFFGIFRVKASNIIWLYATPCRPVTDCKMNDLEWPSVAIWRQIRFWPALCCRIDASFGAHCTNLNEDRPILSAAKCRPMTLVSENIRVIQIFAGVLLGRIVKRHWGFSTTAIFGDLGGYVFENFRDTASSIIWRYATPCRPVSECKMNDLEWPWVAIWCQNPFLASTSWIRVFECQKIIQPLRFCGVLCIARSVSYAR